MRARYTDIIDSFAKPYLKPEHAKWLNNNYHHPDTEGIAKEAADTARNHPDVVAATAASSKAMDDYAANKTPELKDRWQSLESASDTIFGKKIAEHFGALVDAHVAGTADRELKDRVARATADGNSAPITQKSNGKYVAGCLKCGGSGKIGRFANYDQGKCYDCKGLGYFPQSTEYDSAEELRSAMVAGRVAQATRPREVPKAQTYTTPTTPAAPAAKPKGFTNKFPGNCVGCGTRVGTGEGITSRGAGGWEVRCVGCHHG